jgi:hypothetical protein
MPECLQRVHAAPGHEHVCHASFLCKLISFHPAESCTRLATCSIEHADAACNLHLAKLQRRHAKPATFNMQRATWLQPCSIRLVVCPLRPSSVLAALPLNRPLNANVGARECPIVMSACSAERVRAFLHMPLNSTGRTLYRRANDSDQDGHSHKQRAAVRLTHYSNAWDRVDFFELRRSVPVLLLVVVAGGLLLLRRNISAPRSGQR